MTVASSPSGAPTATTGAPTWAGAESANSSAGRPVLSTFRTAMSYAGSPPMISASTGAEFMNSTLTDSCASSACCTTCRLVTMYPASSMTKPEPTPPSASLPTVINTTLGNAPWAMAVTDPCCTLPSAAGASGRVDTIEGRSWSGSRPSIAKAPIAPPRTPATSASATTAGSARRGCGGEGSAGRC